MRKSLKRQVSLLAGALAAAALIFPLAASADLASEVGQGQRLAESIHSGQEQCSGLSVDDFELIGEYAMGRYLGDAAAHGAMNRRMESIIGHTGERRMHIALGYRYSGCGGGPASSWMGPMAGMMFGRYGAGAGGSGPGMMGGYPGRDRGGYPNRMMGGGPGSDNDMGVLGGVLIALAAAALGGGLVALVLQRRRRPHQVAAP